MSALPRGLRKASLTTHIATSVGWLGAVAAFLALALAGLFARQDATVRSAYVAMELTGWTVIVPLSLASLLTGIAQSLGTEWGLLRHYWIVAKLLLTTAATALLLIHMQVVERVADAAAGTDWPGSDLGGMRMQLAADAGAALVVLLVVLALSVFKPRGVTRRGWRRQQQARAGATSAPVGV